MKRRETPGFRPTSEIAIICAADGKNATTRLVPAEAFGDWAINRHCEDDELIVSLTSRPDAK